MEDAPLTAQFGALIRRLRQQAGMSQEEFADRCELHRTYISLIERGERTVTIETASKLAKGLGITLSRLFEQLEAQQAKTSGNQELT